MLGSKIINSQLLKENNINVPDFFIIKQEDVLDIDIKIDKNKDLQKQINIIKKQVKQNIKLKYKNKLKTKLYSVRSSCNLEDSQRESFAGQFDTYLNVKEKDLDKRITDCFLSLYNKNVFTYAEKNNIDFNELKMNVMVQEMIPSEISGVLFTSNPQGILNESEC